MPLSPIPIPIATRQQLARRGIGRAELERGLAAGRFVRVRPGYYAAPEAATDLVAAVRVGGIATGVTALRHYGVWVPPEEVALHVAVTPSAHPPSLEPGVVRHWSGLGEPAVGMAFAPIASLPVALEHAMEHLAPDRIVAILDSVLHQRLLSEAAVDEVLRAAPRRVRRAVGGALDGRAESGLESILRYVLRCAGIACAVQVELPGIGRVDLVADGWLIIEADGGQHASAGEMRKDRRRDAAAVLLGLRTLRLGGDLVLHEQDRMLEIARAMLAAGRPRAAAW